MKKLILLVLTVVIMAGCDKAKSSYEEGLPHNVNIFVVDSCEYVQVYSYGQPVIHKGNCRFCAERRRQELQSIIEQLKDK